MEIQQKEKGIIAWFIYNPVAANLLMLAIVLVGLTSFFSVKKSLIPAFRSSAIEVTAIYPGASPSEVERGVIYKIEEAIQARNIVGIDRIESTSLESSGSVRIEVSDGNDIDLVANEVKLAIDGIDTFPSDVENPTLKKLQQSIPVLNLQIYGNDLSTMQLKALANEAKEGLIAAGVSKVVLYGDRKTEIIIEINEATLRKYNLTLQQVASAVSASSIDLPAGSLKSEKGDVLLRAIGKAYTPEEFKGIPILTTADGTQVLLKDIARISEDFSEAVSKNKFDNKNSVGLGIFAAGNEDVLEISEIAKGYIHKQQKTLPKSISMDYWGETGILLQGRLDLMYENLALGALLVFIILSLFMNFPIAFWVMIGIPVCFLGAFFMLPFADVSINMISLFGFILVLGIVVDDAIIIGESAHAYIRKENSNSIETVIRGVKRVSKPAIFGVLTTICAFLPTIFITGRWANFPAACGYVVIFALIFSIIESKLILPAHLAHSEGVSRILNFKWQERLQTKTNGWLDRFIENRYQPFLSKALKNRYITMSAFIAALFLIVSLLVGGYVRYIMTPDVPSDYIRASLTMPRGTPEKTVEKAQLKIIKALENVERTYKEGAATQQSFLNHRFEYLIDTSVRVTLEMVDIDKRSISASEVAKLWRTEVGEIVGAKSFVVSDAQEDDIGLSGDVAYILSSNNDEELYEISKELKKILKKYNGITSVLDGIPESMDEIQFKMKPNAESLGLSFASIARQVREAFFGAEAQRIQRQNEEVRVKVRYPAEGRKSLNDLNELYVRTSTGSSVPLSSVVDLEFKPAKVRKIRINGKPALTISAKVDKKVNEPKKLSADLEKDVFPKLQKKYPSFSYAIAGGTKDDAQMESQLAFGFMLALLGIYALLAIPLASYTQPLVIMSVIPFGFIGAIIGHMIMGLTVSMMSIFGIIALAGVVVNDSLIMVDFINDARKNGVSKLDSIIQAGGQRFRAILLTSLTTFFGIFPILTETSVQAQFVIPMATSLAFGIVFATVITLVLVPCLCFILDDIILLKDRVFNKHKVLANKDEILS